MKLIATCSIILVFLCLKVSGQTLSAEISGMTKYTSFTGSILAPLTKDEKINLTIASRYYANYSKEDMAAVFSSIGYRLTPGFTATAGAMYFGEDPTPMVGFQSIMGKKAVTGMVAPSLTLGEEMSILMISQIQYLKSKNEKTDFVSKVMLLGMFGFDGDAFSRLSLRTGFTKEKLGYGLAIDIDMLADDDFEILSTIGVYLQYNLDF